MSRGAAVLLSLAALLAEQSQRQARAAGASADQEARLAAVAAELRIYHPKQGAFCEARSKRRAAKCTRRAGKSRGILRESLARCLTRPRHRVVYCHATRAEAERIAWRSDVGDGWRDLVERSGLRVARTRREFETRRDTDCLVNESDLTIEFRNGSQLAIFAADRAEDADKLRGGEKDLVIVDEAQQFPALDYFVDNVAEAMLAKPAGVESGELWLTGTPSRQLSGLFFEITKEPEQGPRKAGWDVHEWAVIDNPYFGATAEERWDATAGATLIAKGWSLDAPPPQFIREWLGKWTTGDALYVYAVHAKPPPEFGAVRVDAKTGAYDHAAAVADLPPFFVDESGVQEPIRWYFTMGADFGYRPDPFAWVLWAWSPQIDDVYEMGAWKRTELTPDEMRDHMHAVWAQCKEALVSIRGDAGGAMASASIAQWEEVIKLPIEPADKSGLKETAIELFNGEIYSGRIHYRRGSALLAEQRELQWRLLPSGKRVEWKERAVDGVKHGNHCSDAGLYGLRDILGRQTQHAKPPNLDADEAAAERAQVARWLAASTKRAALDDDLYGGE